MTTDELDALPAGTPIYLPTIWEVQTWLVAGRVPGRNWYTVTHPPDQDGVIDNRRPVYLDAVTLMGATLNERAAWYAVLGGLADRREWIYKHHV